MNMITALLGATGLLLVVAVVLTVMKMNNANDEAELKELRAELAALSAQQSQLNPPAPSPPIDPGALAADPTSANDEAELKELRAELAVLDAQQNQLNPPAPAPPISPDPLPGPEDGAAGIPATSGGGVPTRAQLEAELAKAERENELLKEEAKEGLISKPMIEAAKKQKARASTVKEAWLQAKVIEWVARQPDQEAGGFAIIELHRDVQPGTILAIRRQTGIYGRLRVDHLYPETKQASANPIRGTFPDGGTPVIKPGDELILPPFGS